MQKLAEICIKRPVFASMLILALVVVGATAYYKLGVDRLPSIDLPTVYVRTTLPGAGPEEVETQVSEIIEEAVNTVEGIEELRSISSTGSSVVIIRFDLSRDIDVAAQDVRDRVAAVLRRLPNDVDPPTVAKSDADSDPSITIAVSSDRALRELTEFAETTVKEQLERSIGVGEVRVVGGARRTVNVWLDADKLVSYQLPVTAVRDAIARQNADVPGGQVTGKSRELTLRTMGRLSTAEEFNDIAIETRNGQPIRVRDIGRAEDGSAEQRSASRLNGKPTVTLEVRRQSGANTVRVIEGVKAKLAEIQPQLPQDVRLEVLQDQSRYIYNALHEINVHLVLGSILACLVVLAFMRSWRSTIIAGVAIPTSVVATFGMMWALNFTLNSVTMLALVLMVGIVIDDAIVVLENIFRFVEEKKMNSFEAARAATAEIGLAVLATTLSLVVIFIPVSFMSSVSGRFLYQFGITAAVAVMVSLLVSFTLTPMMSARLLRGEAKKHAKRSGGTVADANAAPNGESSNGNGHAGNGHADATVVDPQALSAADAHTSRSRGGFYGYIDRSYTWMLEFAMRHRIAVTVVAILVILSSVPLYQAVRLEYTPGNVDEGEFAVSVTGPQSTSWAATNAAIQAIEEEVRQVRGVQLVLGSSGGGFTGGVNTGNIYVRMVPHEQRVWSITRMLKGFLHGDFTGSFKDNYSQRDVIADVRKRVAKFKDVRVAVRAYSPFNTGGGRYEIDFVFKGPELQELARYTDLLRQQSDKLGIVDADTTLKLDAPELRVKIDRAKAADLGIDAADIGTALRLMVGGETEVSRYRDPKAGEDYLVQLRLTEADRSDPTMLDQLYLPRRAAGTGGAPAVGSPGQSGSSNPARLVRLSNIASLSEEITAGRIDRTDRARSANLRASVGPGYALGDRLAAIQEAADELRQPPVNMSAAYTTTIAGRGAELQTTFTEFLIAFSLSIVFMYMILASQFESVLHPFTILLSLPLSVPFALFSLWATGGTLNLYSALGILVLFGVVKKNSILQIDHMNQLRERGVERHTAIIQANRDRLRPILMTTLALVAGMLPLALGTGPGAEERQAVAVVVIGGQTLSLLLTLLVTPVAYSLFDDFGSWVRRRRRSTEVDDLAPAIEGGTRIPA
ncbi:efflux RND transporter permease subunit [Humisphaera borealis]|uniref:Efflux RND transporter permease subunit n=1 Tax=Humisphaera borealis TaxID=2807512 RepID=A0A7M2X625_9BACT|nr:efflux RND transporter permease subunit [Humisphaera borealis]QOV92280.1 efflux RND transporter permease subunit [Humisphaera borealis]